MKNVTQKTHSTKNSLGINVKLRLEHFYQKSTFHLNDRQIVEYMNFANLPKFVNIHEFICDHFRMECNAGDGGLTEHEQ